MNLVLIKKDNVFKNCFMCESNGFYSSPRYVSAFRFRPEETEIVTSSKQKAIFLNKTERLFKLVRNLKGVGYVTGKGLWCIIKEYDD